MSMIKAILSIAAMLFFGALEGWAFVSAGLVAPSGMKAQMRFASFGVMKMFLSAVGSSMIAQSLMELSGSKRFAETRDYARKGLSPSIVALGCCILGVGMFMCGSGPTMMPSQLAASVSTAPSIVLGAFAGGLAYGLLEPILPKNCGAPKQPLDAFKKYTSIALPLGAALVGVSFALESFFPSISDWQNVFTSGAAMALIPSIAGLVIGFNQIPLRLIAGRGQGGSTPVVAILATLTGGAIQKKHQLNSWYKSLQTVYVYPGTFLGALIAAKYFYSFQNDATNSGANSGVWQPLLWSSPEARVSHVDAFVGGFLMLLGARIADGCTCGHGITGFSELSPNSILATCCIFGGGMGAAYLGITTGL